MSEGTRGREDGPTQALAYAAECAASATQRGSARWRQLAAACTPWQSGCSGASFASQGRHEWCPPHDDGGFLRAGGWGSSAACGQRWRWRNCCDAVPGYFAPWVPVLQNIRPKLPIAALHRVPVVLIGPMRARDAKQCRRRRRGRVPRRVPQLHALPHKRTRACLRRALRCAVRVAASASPRAGTSTSFGQAHGVRKLGGRHRLMAM
jgi:hypothetical protein